MLYRRKSPCVGVIFILSADQRILKYTGENFRSANSQTEDIPPFKPRPREHFYAVSSPIKMVKRFTLLNSLIKKAKKGDRNIRKARVSKFLSGTLNLSLCPTSPRPTTCLPFLRNFYSFLIECRNILGYIVNKKRFSEYFDQLWQADTLFAQQCKTQHSPNIRILHSNDFI